MCARFCLLFFFFLLVCWESYKSYHMKIKHHLYPPSSHCTENVLLVLLQVQSMENDELPPEDGMDWCGVVLASKCCSFLLCLWNQWDLQQTSTGAHSATSQGTTGRNHMDALLKSTTAILAFLAVDYNLFNTVFTDVLVPLFLYESWPQNCWLLHHSYLLGCYLQSSSNICEGL